MLVLALDTTTRGGSIALRRDAELLETFEGDPARTHATRLPGDLIDCLGRHGLALRDVDVFAVAAGPGSFTGLRIGIAAVQGLAFAHAKSVVAVSTLDALAYGAFLGQETWPGDSQIAAVMDAQRHEVFTALYRIRPRGFMRADTPTAADLGELEVVERPSVDTPLVTVSRWSGIVDPDAPVSCVGDGALAYEADFARLHAASVSIIRPVPPLAPAIAFIAWRRAGGGLAIHPHAIRPLYVRRPDAELARDRKRQAEAAGQGSRTNA